jgi:rod shape determining protein RodA
MKFILNVFNKDILFSLAVTLSVFLGVSVLNAISPLLFPGYYVFYIVGLLAFILFSKIDFEILRLYSTHLYVLSVISLLFVLVIGQVTRGTIRWIPIGSISFQPSELVRPFLILFFAANLGNTELGLFKLVKSFLLLGLPLILILIQPSLGVTLLISVGLFGVLIAKDFDKKHLISIFMVALCFLPLIWLILRPYQKDRILGFFHGGDKLGAGYNSIQSMIAVGSGKLFGRSLGKGVQTQLEFLPEKQSDFIFAAISEEMGFAGSLLLLTITFVLFWRISFFMENAVSPIARSFIAGIFLSLLTQIFIHTGMNMGLLPVTGVPFPLVSAGGSSFLGTMISLGIIYSAYKGSNNSFL